MAASVELNATARQCFSEARITASTTTYAWTHVLRGKWVDDGLLAPYSGLIAVPSLFPIAGASLPVVDTSIAGSLGNVASAMLSFSGQLIGAGKAYLFQVFSCIHI